MAMRKKRKVEEAPKVIANSIDALADCLVARVMDAIEMHTFSRMPITSSHLREVIVGGILNRQAEETEEERAKKEAESVTARHDLDDVIATKAVYLYVPFDQRDRAKSLGAKWDFRRRRWYIPKGRSLSPFAEWLEENDAWRESQEAHILKKKKEAQLYFDEDEDDDSYDDECDEEAEEDEEDEEDDLLLPPVRKMINGVYQKGAFVGTAYERLSAHQTITIRNGVVMSGCDALLGFYAKYNADGMIVLEGPYPKGGCGDYISVGGMGGGVGGGGGWSS